jgi:hypothetical protein
VTRIGDKAHARGSAMLTESPYGLPGRIFRCPMPFSPYDPCYAGIGRTGLIAATMAKRLQGVSGEAAIAWVRRSIPRAVETPAQRRLLVGDHPQERNPTRAP